MAFGLTSTGFTLKTFDDIRTEVDDYQRANIDSSFLLNDDSDLGQVNIAHCLELAKLWELGQALYSAFDPDAANGWSLDQLASLTGTTRNKYTKTTVTGQVTLNPNKNLPAGSIANLNGRPNSRFVTLTEVPADPSGGTFDVVFEAEEAGATTVEIGQLSEITVAVSGWTAVNNSAVGTPGSEPEEDVDFRDKRDRELESSGSTNLDAIVAGVSAVSGVVDVLGRENDKNVAVDGLPPHSVAITVRGGADQDIAEAIFVEKSAGITTFGTTSTTVEDSQNVEHTIRHTNATSLTFYCDVEVYVNDDWNGATSISNIKTAIQTYVNSLGIGDDVIIAEVRAAVMSEEGVFDISFVKMDFSASPTGTVNLTVNDDEYAESDVANISVVTTP